MNEILGLVDLKIFGFLILILVYLYVWLILWVFCFLFWVDFV